MGRLYDNHNHSQFSFDGKRTSVREAALQAKAKGLGGLCFTDHCDFFVPGVKAEKENLLREVFDVAPQQAEIRAAREDITGIGIFMGAEIGLYKDCHQQIRKFLSDNKFDQIIASVHYIDGIDPFYGGYYQGKDWKEAYGHYLETLYNEMVWLGDFDIMGHYDYVARYAPYPQTSILYKDFSDILDQMMKYLISEGKALEINTKSYQDYKGRTPVLDRDILTRYRELGGEIISLGSDSHDPFRVGDKFDFYVGYLKSLGYKYGAHFEGRRLVQENL